MLSTGVLYLYVITHQDGKHKKRKGVTTKGNLTCKISNKRTLCLASVTFCVFGECKSDKNTQKLREDIAIVLAVYYRKMLFKCEYYVYWTVHHIDS